MKAFECTYKHIKVRRTKTLKFYTCRLILDIPYLRHLILERNMILKRICKTNNIKSSNIIFHT